MIIDGFVHQLPDIDPEETKEWLDSLDSVVSVRGKTRATYLLARLMERAREGGVGVPAMVSTPYVNTIPPEEEPWFPGDEFLERRIRAYIRWNAAAMVTRANRQYDGIGGHLSTYQSAAALYEVGFNHFFQGKDGGFGDQVFIQGHAAPGIYARAYLEGRLTETELDSFRREVGGGLPSYPHPRRMPDFWEFPTVSMGLSPLNAIYQARFNRYLYQRELVDTSAAKVWCFLGDGETDEPESMAALSLAGRERLDNLIFVINCNLQRLDGPVRGNGKIIQELEAVYRGAGWNVIKVIWGRQWDDLLARDVDGVLINQMNTTVDGEFQRYSIETGAYIREHFFGPDPRLRQMVDHLSDDDLRNLPRGGHDYRKLYAAYKTAVEQEGAPTVILAKTIKGWTLGPEIEARNATHQIKKMTEEELKTFRDRLYLEIPDEQLEEGLPPYFHPGLDSDECRYLMERRAALDGSLPTRVDRSKTIALPGTPTATDEQADPFGEFLLGTGDKVEATTTAAMTRMIRNLLRDPVIGEQVVPIIPDEARTFGMDALFAEVNIYAPFGQLYEPVDYNVMLSYKESPKGQVLEEGITEAGSMGSFTAAGTAYATWGTPMIPFFVFYSMFGFQRVGDLIWSFGDQRGRGFLCGATAGRTTLQGEGLQHNDGHSPMLAASHPSCLVYDPAFAYELAVIVQDGLQRMYGEDREDCFYYLTLYNEAYPMPAMPDGPAAPGATMSIADGIVQGLYLFRAATAERTHRAQILASGTGMRAALRAQEMLAADWDVAADLWSAPGWKQLREDAIACERWDRLHPTAPPRVPYVREALGGADGPVVAVTDFVRAVPEQIARWVPQPFVPLGTDGYGLSDTRASLRRYFEVDAEHVVVAALAGLAQTGDVKAELVAEAIKRYEIDPEALDPMSV
ncbi:MAG TPA: pyruvate dehydrogenase (acetyl-transferring), homodimeric type [Acidimicrobiia bacterium]|nr:pyruvate dehydrogenase (acetyl-transferring), homodimeric type [Acidimicrobiia bacterium]